MARTLIIKGANFSANKLATVVFEDVPCTGLSFAQSSYSVTQMGAFAINYTVTPSNTTDAITWTSSNTNVATVEDGTVTVVGIGTTTITATCGSHTASATVTAEIAYVPHYEFTTAGQSTGTHWFSSSRSYSRITAFGADGQRFTNYGAIVTTAGIGPFYPVLIPNGVTKIEIKTTNTNAFWNAALTHVIWCKDEFCGDSTFPNGCYVISQEEDYNIRDNATKVFTIPSGATGFVFHTRPLSEGTESTDPNTFVQGLGLSIRFLSE